MRRPTGCKRNSLSSESRVVPATPPRFFSFSSARTLSFFAFIPINLEGTGGSSQERLAAGCEGEPAHKGGSRMRLIQKCRRALASLGARIRFHDKNSTRCNQTRGYSSSRSGGESPFISEKRSNKRKGFFCKYCLISNLSCAHTLLLLLLLSLLNLSITIRILAMRIWTAHGRLLRVSQTCKHLLSLSQFICDSSQNILPKDIALSNFRLFSGYTLTSFFLLKSRLLVRSLIAVFPPLVGERAGSRRERGAFFSSSAFGAIFSRSVASSPRSVIRTRS